MPTALQVGSRGWCCWDASTFDAFVPLLMGGIPCRLFFALVDPTMAGVHDLCRRFSHFLSRVISKKVMWSSNEGHGPLEVRSLGAF